MNQVKRNYQVVAATISTIYFSLFAYGAFIFIQQFEQIFNSFDAELPIQTTILIGSYRYWGILAVISGIVVYKVSKNKNSQLMKLLAWLIAFSCLLALFAIWGVYSPVLESDG